MVAATYDAAMVRVFADEGGYTNDPKDPGGPTNFGITLADARMYWKANATAADVKAMPKSVASDIYKAHYAAPVRYDSLPAGFDYSVFDAGINSGIGRAIPWAGKALGINAVSIEPVISAAALAPDKVSLIQKYWGLRVAFLHGLRTWSHFGPGWSRRCANGEAAAVKMWLNLGAAMSPAATKKAMDAEAKKAKTAATKTGTGAATATAGSAGSALDWSQIGGKVALALFLAAIAIAVIYFVRQTIVHNQRAAAYAAA
jgi:lysozyme family protein